MPAKKNTRGPKPGTGGRPKGPTRVKLTTMILPATRKALGRSPGPAIDKLVQAGQPASKSPIEPTP